MGAGATTTARQAPQEGPRPFLSVLPTARAAVPEPRGSCNSHKQKPQGGTSPAALEDCWAPTPFTGLPGPTARGWEARRVAATLGDGVLAAALPNLQGAGGTEAGQLGGRAGKRPRGPPAPTPQGLGSWTVVGGPRGQQSSARTHPASGRRSSQRSPRPGPPGTSA